jgi:hypothetical protein
VAKLGCKGGLLTTFKKKRERGSLTGFYFGDEHQEEEHIRNDSESIMTVVASVVPSAPKDYQNSHVSCCAFGTAFILIPLYWIEMSALHANP